VVLILLVTAKTRILTGGGWRFALTRVIAPAALLLTAVSGTIYLALPKTPVVCLGSSRKLAWFRLERSVCRLSNELFDGSRKTLDEVRAVAMDRFHRDGIKNWFTAAPITEDDSLGDFTITENRREIVFRAYSPDGSPYTVLLQDAGKRPD